MAKILVVDDDPDIVEACTLFLQKAGHDVSGASSREDGMKAVKSAPPDLVILDVMMVQPDDGFVMAQALRKSGFKAPILMLTSVGKALGLSFGKDDAMVPVNDFVEKPVDPKVLVDKIAELLRQ